jgi:integrase
MAHAANQVKIADNKITLYQRDDVKDAQWHCRMMVAGYKGYVRRSTGTADLDRAKERSLQILGELNQRQSQNLPIRRKTFAEVAASFLRDCETRWKEGRNSQGRYEIMKGTITRYLMPYFGKRDITLVQKKDLMDYRAWRQSYWVTGPGFHETGKVKAPPAPATLKQEWTAMRGVFVHGVDLGFVSPNLLPMLKHEKNKVEKRPAFTAEEYRRLWLFMRQWIKQTNNPRVTADRQLLRDYVLIMANTGMRKGEARQIKWRDVIPHQTEHGEWMTIQVNRGKTGERLVVCQPGTDRYFNRLRKRGHNTEPDDLVFCHADGLPIQEFTGFAALLKAASLRTDSKGDNHTIYSLRHTYATLRLQNGTNVYWLKKNMGTSVAQIEAHYGQTNVLVGIEFETAKRKKQKKTGDAITIKDVPKQPIKMDEIVPVGAVDLTPADDGDDE